MTIFLKDSYTDWKMSSKIHLYISLIVSTPRRKSSFTQAQAPQEELHSKRGCSLNNEVQISLQ